MSDIVGYLLAALAGALALWAVLRRGGGRPPPPCKNRAM